MKRLNPEQMLQAAIGFSAAADRCSDEGKPPLLVQEVVCRSFAAELFLKTLLTLQGSQVQGHDLADLTRQLAEHSKLRLLADCRCTQEMFSSRMCDVAKAFLHWRYTYEAEAALDIDLGFLCALEQSVRCQCLEAVGR